MPYETLKVIDHYDGAVCEIVLNTPPGNILTARMMKELAAQFEIEAGDRDRKLIVISGTGDHFCFGASVEEHRRDQVGTMLPAFHRLMGTILSHPTPTLAKVTGQCLGGGFELALVCSFIAASDEARFSTPEISLGVFPPVAALLLPPLAGAMFAAKTVLTGARMSADDLLRAGLLLRVSHRREIEDDVSAFIEKEILPKSASSLRFAQRATRLDLAQRYTAQIKALERLYLEELMASHDANEGIEAFIGKRPAEWKNA